MRFVARWVDEDGDEYDRAIVEVGPGYARVDGESVPVEATPDQEGALAAAASARGEGCPGHRDEDIVIEERDA